MRLFIVGVALFFTTTATAQSRWTLSAGPEWRSFSSDQFFGGRVRGEYDLIRPNLPLRLRLEVGGYWEPTHSYFGRLLDGSTFGGSTQNLDLSFGMSAAITPLPHARIAPYAMIGVLARQTWVNGINSYMPPGGPLTVSNAKRTLGDVIVPVGLGMRARMGGRMFQFEIRQLQHTTSVTVGTTLPF